jgi:hypothetical protein
MNKEQLVDENATVPSTNSTRRDLESNPVRRDGKPVT